MNCKQGDIAIIVRSAAGNEGKVVTCLELIIDPPECTPGAYWVTDASLLFVYTDDNSPAPPKCLSRDDCMKPLRDDPVKDETLSWEPVPTKEEVR